MVDGASSVDARWVGAEDDARLRTSVCRARERARERTRASRKRRGVLCFVRVFVCNNE